MPAELNFVQLTTRPINLNGWTITPAYINHPGLALAYKIETGKSKIVYMTDVYKRQVQHRGHQFTNRTPW